MIVLSENTGMSILLFGATGNAGRAIAAELATRQMTFTAVVRNGEKAKQISGIAQRHIVADVMDETAVRNICRGYDIVISALGKSVSLADRSKPTFHDVDYLANNRILNDAIACGVKKFAYISAYGAERYPDLAYFSAHHTFEEALVGSGLHYSVIKPTGLFSAFAEMIPMARQGRLMNIGSGTYKTNPLHEADLAEIVVNSLSATNAIIEAGGPETYTRAQIAQMAQDAVKPRRLRSMPVSLARLLLPLVKIADANAYDKLAFVMTVMAEDTIAPRYGNRRLEDYFREKTME